MTKTQFSSTLNIINTIGREVESSLLGESGQDYPTQFTLWTISNPPPPPDSFPPFTPLSMKTKDFIFVSYDEYKPFCNEEMTKQGEIIIDDFNTFNEKFLGNNKYVSYFEALEEIILNQLITQGLIKLDSSEK